MDRRSEATGALATGGSALDAVAEVHDTVADPVLLQQLQLDTGVAGECGLAFTDEHRIDEELAPIDQPGVERARSGSVERLIHAHEGVGQEGFQRGSSVTPQNNGEQMTTPPRATPVAGACTT